MKKCILSIIVSFMCITMLFAQSPKMFKYQTVVRNSSGIIVQNQTVGFKISLLQGSITGNASYCETQSKATNDFGIVNLEIGNGTIISGSIDTINWANGSYFVKIELDINNGVNYITMGTSQLLSVPYALYAEKAGTAGYSETDPVFATSAAKGITSADITNWNNKLDSEIDSSVTNELQTLSISNDTIYLSNGGFVKLPPLLSPPTATISPATNIQEFSATINGVVNAKGLSTTVVFEWGTTTSYGNTINVSQSPVTGNIDHSVSANLTGLQSSTTYHYRIKANNAVDVAYSDDYWFTDGLSSPQLTTNVITSITDISATTGGNIIYDGGSAVFAKGVCYSTSPGPTLANDTVGNGAGAGTFISNITGLTLGTTYYVRAYALNSIGTSYGNERTFTTVALPTLTTSDFSDVKGNSAKAGGSIIDNGGGVIIAQGLCWSTSPNPTIADSKDTSFTTEIAGLTPNTVYYVRAYATNVAGTGYGNQISFNSGYIIGSTYDGGLVFYNDGNNHGLICTPTDQSSSASWGCYGTNIGSTSLALGTGASNTDSIVAKCVTTGIAARICYDLTIDIYSDWYLPSKAELNLMYLNLHKQNLGGFVSDYYWSSSEDNVGLAWRQHFAYGSQHNDGKDYPVNVRAVRSF